MLLNVNATCHEMNRSAAAFHNVLKWLAQESRSTINTVLYLWGCKLTLINVQQWHISLCPIKALFRGLFFPLCHLFVFILLNVHHAIISHFSPIQSIITHHNTTALASWAPLPARLSLDELTIQSLSICFASACLSDRLYRTYETCSLMLFKCWCLQSPPARVVWHLIINTVTFVSARSFL